MTSAASPPLRGRFATVDEAMDAAADQFGDREAYVDGDRRCTFGEWIALADTAAADLVAAGVRPGDVVAITLPPSLDYAIAYAAVVRAGAVATGLNTRLGPREVDAIVERSQPAVVISEPPVGDARSGLGDRRPRRSPDDPAVIIWTSGTTGLPKGAWFDHRGLEAAVATAGVMAAPFDRRLVATPFAHAGYMAKLWEQLAWGITVVITPQPWSVDEMVRLLESERITVVGGVPTQWAKVVDHLAVATADLSSLRLCLSATAPAPPELVKRMRERLGCSVVVRYAMTESPSITGTEPGDAPEVLYRSVGRPQRGVEVELRDDEGRAVADGDVGRVHVRSACAMRGYWRDETSTAEAFTDDGWLRSTDLGRLDRDGNLVLVGRVSDMYIRGGYNVHPLEVEHVLAEHPAVAQVSVVGVPAHVIGEKGVAFVVPAAGAAPPTAVELRSWCGERLADYKAPDDVVIVDVLPVTSMMKVDKAALAATALARDAGLGTVRPPAQVDAGWDIRPK